MRVRCPTCRRDIQWSDAYPQRPFCSERCRLIDLGAWLSETHAIPGEAIPGEAAQFDEEPAAGEDEPTV